MKKFLKKLLLLLKQRKIIKNRKLYLVVWEDISAFTEWTSSDSVQENLPALCVSTGFIWSSDNVKTHVVSDIGFDSSNGNVLMNEVGSVTTIPTKNIIKKIELPYSKYIKC